jgi:hypothetical protein
MDLDDFPHEEPSDLGDFQLLSRENALLALFILLALGSVLRDFRVF